MISDIKELISTKMGWALSRYSDIEFRDRLTHAGKVLGFGSFEEFAAHMSLSPLAEDEMQTIADFFTVGESYFFRYRSDFEVLGQKIIPEMCKEKQSREPIRIWCAGCSSGEEPYTAAIYLQNSLVSQGNQNINIQGTDVSAYALKKARKGLYTQWSLRDTSSEERVRFFIPSGKDWQLNPATLHQVQYSYHNLADDKYGTINGYNGKFDVIFCRNVLIYFTKEKMLHVLEEFHRKLDKYGVLIVSPCESSLIPNDLYTHEIIQSTTILRPRKDTGSLRPVNARREKPQRLRPQPKLRNITEFHGRKVETSDQRNHYEKTQTPLHIDYFDHAQTLFSEGASESAAGVLLLMLSTPGYTYQSIHFQLLIHSLINAGKLTDALVRCEQALQQEPLSIDMQLMKAAILQELGQFAEAKSCYHKIIYLDPENTGALFQEAMIEKQLGNLQQAETLYNRAEKTLLAKEEDTVISSIDNMTVSEIRRMIKGMRNA